MVGFNVAGLFSGWLFYFQISPGTWFLPPGPHNLHQTYENLHFYTFGSALQNIKNPPKSALLAIFQPFL